MQPYSTRCQGLLRRRWELGYSVVATVVFLLVLSVSLAMLCDRYRFATKAYKLTFIVGKICLASASPVHSGRGSIAARGGTAAVISW
jgi:hypothetical protein